MARSGQGQQDEAIRELTRAILNATRERKATTKTAKETKGGGGGGIRAAIGGAALSTGLAAAGAVASTVTRALEASLKSGGRVGFQTAFGASAVQGFAAVPILGATLSKKVDPINRAAQRTFAAFEPATRAGVRFSETEIRIRNAQELSRERAVEGLRTQVSQPQQELLEKLANAEATARTPEIMVKAGEQLLEAAKLMRRSFGGR